MTIKEIKHKEIIDLFNTPIKTSITINIYDYQNNILELIFNKDQNIIIVYYYNINRLSYIKLLTELLNKKYIIPKSIERKIVSPYCSIINRLLFIPTNHFLISIL